MKISAVAPQYTNVGGGHGVHANKHAAGAEKHHHDGHKVHDTDDDHADSRKMADPGGRIKGDFSLLQAGHFKGVAEVRLSIKLHIELSGVQQNTAHARASEAIADLDETMTHALEAVPEGSDKAQVKAIKAAQNQFSDSIQSAAQNLHSGDVSHEAFISEISEAYEKLAAQVQSALTGAPSVSDKKDTPELKVVDAPVARMDEEGHDIEHDHADDLHPEDGVVATDTEQYVANLGQVFNDAISGIRADFASAINAPEFQPPSGNGGAFEKFLNIYRELVDAMTGDEDRVMGEADTGMAVDEQV